LAKLSWLQVFSSYKSNEGQFWIPWCWNAEAMIMLLLFGFRVMSLFALLVILVMAAAGLRLVFKSLHDYQGQEMN
jgi:purine-cytosine permease-like protein